MKHLLTLALTLLCGTAAANAHELSSNATDAVAASSTIDSLVINTTWALSADSREIDDAFVPTFKAHIEFPVATENSVLTNAVKEWVSEHFLNGCGHCPIELKAACTDYLNAMGTDDRDIDEEIEVKKVYEDANVITFVAEKFFYACGGAHGGLTTLGATFRKNDGKIFGWNMFRNDADFQPLLKAGLTAYFQGCDNTTLEDALMVSEPYGTDYLPRPESNPWVEADGVHFIYQQYEACCYALGMPAFTLPLNQVKDLLTPMADSLFSVTGR